MTTTTAWALVVVAGVLEIAWAIGMKASDGLRKPALAAGTIVLMILSFACLAQAMRKLPVGTAYAAWTGIGTVGAAALGVVIFKEPATAGRIVCMTMIVAGIVGLKLLA